MRPVERDFDGDGASVERPKDAKLNELPSTLELRTIAVPEPLVPGWITKQSSSSVLLMFLGLSFG